MSLGSVAMLVLFHQQVTPHNQVVIPHCPAADVVRVRPETQRAVLVEPDQSLPSHWLAAKPLASRTEPDLVAASLHHLLGAVLARSAGGDRDVLPAEYLWDQATPLTRDSEIASGAALVGSGDDRPAKAVFLGGEEAVNDEAELLVVLHITLAHKAWVLRPLYATIWQEVHTAFELAVALLA